MSKSLVVIMVSAALAALVAGCAAPDLGGARSPAALAGEGGSGGMSGSGGSAARAAGDTERRLARAPSPWRESPR